LIERRIDLEDSSDAVVLLQELKAACLSEQPAQRPSFNEICQRLSSASESWHSSRSALRCQ
jgi:hypothetical protein